MFSPYHFLWLAICITIIAVSLLLLRKCRPDLKKVLTICILGCVLSETTKVFGNIRLIPSDDGTMFFPYIPLTQLPLHLCSIQIINILIARFSKDGKKKDILLAFMYPTCLVGAFCALMIPTVLIEKFPPAEAFAHPQCYEYFLYHAMLIVLGSYIPMSHQVEISGKNFFYSLGILLGLAFVSLYANSIFAVPTYINGELVAVEMTTNFFFTYAPPIDLKLTELWQWYAYLGTIVAIAVILLALAYLPFAKKKSKAMAK